MPVAEVRIQRDGRGYRAVFYLNGRNEAVFYGTWKEVQRWAKGALKYAKG